VNTAATYRPKDKSLTMDSREIAEIVGVRHDNVLRDIRTQLGQLPGGVLRFEDTYQNEQNGQTYRCFKLPYRETMILVSGYSVELRAKVVDRWIELERQAAIDCFNVPRDFASALRLAAEQADQIAAQAKQIEVMAPKADYFDAVASSKTAIHMNDVAKSIDVPGMGRNNLFSFLREHGVLMLDNRPYQEHVDSGRFRVVQASYQNSKGETVITHTTLVYQKGVAYILKLLADNGHNVRAKVAPEGGAA
jgi:phage antirepressor YoqD-like protein